MAWIELHRSVWEHRKTLLLADLLGIDETYAAAHMARLWTWAINSATDGDLTGMSPQMIARCAGWKGDPNEFVEAAIRVGYIDRFHILSGGNSGSDSGGESGGESGGVLILHDWMDYAGKLVEKREKARSDGALGNHKRWHVGRGLVDPACPFCQEENPENADKDVVSSKGGSDMPVSGSDSGSDIGSDSGEESHLTLPYRTKKNNDHSPATNGYPDEFEEWWRYYPRKVAKRKAYNAWVRIQKKGKDNPDPPTHEQLLKAAKNYALQCQRDGTEPGYILHGATFLSVRDRRWEDYVDGSAEQVPLDAMNSEHGLEHNPYRRVHV